ncbi:unnamed protein product, partial [Hymenolepis diminuta]
KRVDRFLPFSVTASFHLKSTSVLRLSLGLTQVTHKSNLVFHTRTTHACQIPDHYISCSSPLFLSTLPFLSLSLYQPF